MVIILWISNSSYLSHPHVRDVKNWLYEIGCLVILAKVWIFISLNLKLSPKEDDPALYCFILKKSRYLHIMQILKKLTFRGFVKLNTTRSKLKNLIFRFLWNSYTASTKNWSQKNYEKWKGLYSQTLLNCENIVNILVTMLCPVI